MNEETNATAKPEIAHVVTLDVVGYSKRLIDEQTTLMVELNEVVRQTTRFRVADAAGKLIRLTTGDGMALVFFGEPDAAMDCATEIATALLEHPRIQVRIGLHSGPVSRVVDLNDQPNVAGAGIDIAQRVMDCGDAGHILLSKRIAYDLAPLPRWNMHLHELGEVKVKHGVKIDIVNFYTDKIGNAAVPSKIKRARDEEAARARRTLWLKRAGIGAAALILTFSIAAALIFYRREIAPPLPKPVAPEKSIAVLPFVDLSAAHDQKYFCDGISEEILDALSKVEGLRVAARTSSFSFKGKDVDAREIARKLKVSNLLEGSLRREGNHIRVNAQLVNARDGFEVWSGKIDKEMGGVFAMQDEITRAIVDSLQIKLAGPPEYHSQNTEAYDLYLQGLYLSNKSTEPELRRSLDLFRRALQLDPKLAQAWTGIAKDWNWLADNYARPKEAYPQMEMAARKALATNERDAEAHLYVGEAKRVLSFDLNADETEINRALAIDPNSALGHLSKALVLTTRGQRGLALPELHRAVQLDPLSPVVGNLEVYLDVANDRLDDALAAAKRTMEIDPNYFYFEPNLALVYREQGKLQQALEIYERVQAARKQPSAGLAITYARLNRPDDARRILRQLIGVADTQYFPADQIAAVYLAVGDNDSAVKWIERAINDCSGLVQSIAYAPEFRSLRNDSRYSDLLRRVGLDPKNDLPQKRL
jgi:adenylate cyclase